MTGLQLPRHIKSWGYPQLHLGELGAGRRFNHRVVVNTWQGIGAPQSPKDTSRMGSFAIRLDTPELLDQILGTINHIAEIETGWVIPNPAGSGIQLLRI